MVKRYAFLALCALVLFTACNSDIVDPPVQVIKVQTISYLDDGLGYLQFYTNDVTKCLGGSGYYAHFGDVDVNTAFTSLEVKVIKNSGKSGYMHGVTFCYQDDKHYYRLLISLGGNYEVFKRSGDTFYWWNFSAVPPAWLINDNRFTYPSSPNLLTGYEKVNAIKVVTPSSGVFDLYFNGTKSASFTDTDSPFTSGKYGFMSFVGLATDEDFPSNPVDLRYKLISFNELGH